MLGSNYNSRDQLETLINDYLCMSQKGTVVFTEEAVVFAITKFFHEEDNLEDALIVISQGIEQFPNSARLIAYKATLLMEQGQDTEVILRYLDQALLIAPLDSRILLVKAEVLHNAEHFEEALSTLSLLKTFASSNELEKAFLLESYIYDKNEEYEPMFDALSRTLRINPRNQEALLQMWLAISLTERHEESIALHEAIIDEDPYSYQAWLNLAHTYCEMQRFDEAIEAFEYAIVANEDYSFSYEDCAMACLQAGRFEKALELYQDIEQRFGSNAESATKIGLCHQQTENYLAALTWYHRALIQDKNNPEAHFHIGECLMVQGDYSNAIKAFNRAISIAGQFEEYHLALARTYEKDGQLENAEAAYYKLIEVAPERTEHWLYHVNFLRNNQGFEAALEVLDEAEMNISRNADLLYSRVICLFQMGNRNEALNFLQEALAQDFALHGVIFQELPHLEKDKDVLDLIRVYR